jgi:hypothetical protein
MGDPRTEDRERSGLLRLVTYQQHGITRIEIEEYSISARSEVEDFVR